MDHEYQSYNYSRVDHHHHQRNKKQQHRSGTTRSAAGGGFQLNPPSKRFSVYGLRKRVLYFLRRTLRIRSWNWPRRIKYSYSSCGCGLLQALAAAAGSVTRIARSRSSSSSSSSSCGSRGQIGNNNINDYLIIRSSSYRRSNSFYAEAISDCLEFIRSSNR